MLIPCTSGARPQVVLPKAVLRKLGLVEGDFLKVVPNGRPATARRKPTPNDEERLTPSEARQLRRGLQQTRQGKTTPWQEVKDELGL